jgi:hypothetical protein
MWYEIDDDIFVNSQDVEVINLVDCKFTLRNDDAHYDIKVSKRDALRKQLKEMGAEDE